MKLKRILLLFALLFTAVMLKAQGVNNLWILGYDSTTFPTGRTTIDFNSGTPSISWSLKKMGFYLSNAVISNSNGELLFYTNGVWIANSTDDTLLNGTGLNPSTNTQQHQDGLVIPQSDIIIPFPNDPTKYYLFHEALDSAIVIPTNLYYSIIDITLDGGLGGVISKNNVMLHSAFSFGAITACKHANGRDWWLLTHLNQSTCYVKFLITSYGIFGPYYQCIGKYIDVLGANWLSGVGGALGQVTFSQDGNKFTYYDCEGDLDLFDFDRCSGDLSNLIHVPINDSAVVGGAAFSADSKKLYLSSDHYVHQLNLDTSNIPASLVTVAVWDSFASPSPPFYSTFFLSYLAPDNKIYIATGNGTDYLHVINYPDSSGLACDVCQHCVQFPSYNAWTVPNNPNYFLGADTSSVLCDSLFNATEGIEKQNPINIFPNPFNDQLTLHFAESKNEKATIKIFDTFGNLLLSKSIQQTNQQLDLSLLSSGIYFLNLQTHEKNITLKIVKM